MKNKKALIVVAEDWSFLSHRLPLARALHKAGAEVSVLCRVQEHQATIEQEGFRLIPLNIERENISPLNALSTIQKLRKIYKTEKPDVIIHVSLFLSFLGTLAGFLSGYRNIVNLITGLGYIFISQSLKAIIVRTIIKICFRIFSIFKSVILVVQNKDDQRVFEKLGYIKEETLSLIIGSGVNMEIYYPCVEAPKHQQVTFVGRILWAKGVKELIEAARILKQKGKLPKIVLVGEPDLGNPQSATQADIDLWSQENLVQFLGRRDDIADIYRDSTIAILPSWREGLPKSLLEAASCGLPMIATDVPGCNELVKHQENGLLVPLRDPIAIASAIETLIENETLRKTYGTNARLRVETELNDQSIAQQTLKAVKSVIKTDY